VTASLRQSGTQDHGLEGALDNELIAAAARLDTKAPVQLERKVINVNRTVGAMLSGEIAKALWPRRACRPTRSASS
jgi:glutamate synthase (NADPH) large chain